MAKKHVDPEAVGPGKCRLCPRYQHAQSICLPGYGPAAPNYIVILGYPSHVDDTWCRICDRPATDHCRQTDHHIGHVLSNAAGYALRNVFLNASIDPNTVFYTSVVRCTGKLPGIVQIRRCRAYLLDELATLDLSQCHGIMLLGDSAVHGVLNHAYLTVKHTRLRVLESMAPPWGPPVRATYHPVELLLRQSGAITQTEMVADFLDLQKPRDPVMPTALWNSSMCDLPVPQLLGIDLEWTQHGTIRCVGFSDGVWKMVAQSQDIPSFLQWLEEAK